MLEFIYLDRESCERLRLLASWYLFLGRRHCHSPPIDLIVGPKRTRVRGWCWSDISLSVLPFFVIHTCRLPFQPPLVVVVIWLIQQPCAVPPRFKETLVTSDNSIHDPRVLISLLPMLYYTIRYSQCYISQYWTCLSYWKKTGNYRIVC